MSGWEIIIGCIGKPSAGKSTFFNSLIEGNLAKVGNYPFTTIEPNTGITYYTVECPCKKRGLSSKCSPFYGKCVGGTRYIPIKLLDVAGLIPGASTGLGLGNKFLDDLRHADVLIHVIDASGETNEKGENTKGYDPLKDIEWLRNELHLWIFNNIWKRWTNIVRQHNAMKSNSNPPTIAQTLHIQLSGYGTQLNIVQDLVNQLGIHSTADLSTWGEEQINRIVEMFINIRFPTILLLNKCDRGDSEANISRIFDKYSNTYGIIVSSALSECYLNELSIKKFISYDHVTNVIKTNEEDTTLYQIPQSDLNKMNKIRSRIIYRFGSTGVWTALQTAVQLKNPTICYPVKAWTTYSCSTRNDKTVFANCIILREGSTIEKLSYIINPEKTKLLDSAESEDKRTLSVDSVVENGMIIKLNYKEIPNNK